MSEYAQFFVRSPSDEFCPIGTFCRSSVVFSIGRDDLPYGKITPLSTKTLEDLCDLLRDKAKKIEEDIERYEKQKADVSAMPNPVQEKLEAFHHIDETISDLKEELMETKYAGGYYGALATIGEEVQWLDKEDPFYKLRDGYVYGGVEVGSPTVADIKE